MAASRKKKNTPAKKSAPAAKAPRAAQPAAKEPTNGHQAAAVVLFALAILVLCIALIPGGSVWQFLHGFFLGVFGIGVYLIPLLMGYVAIMLALNHPVKSVSGKLWESFALIVALCALLHLFLFNIDPNTPFLSGWWAAIVSGYEQGANHASGGVLGALIGYALEFLLEDVGAKIVMFLLLFVFLMLMTGTTLMKLFHGMARPVQKTGESIRQAYNDAEDKLQQISEERREEKRRSNIDIEMGEGYPPAEKTGRDAVEQAVEEIVNGSRQQAAEPAVNEKRVALEKAASALREEPDARLNELVGTAVQEGAKAKKDEGAVLPDGLPAEVVADPEPVYRLPPVTLLDPVKPFDDSAAASELHGTAELLVKTLREFGVETHVINISRGPAVTRYELEPAAGVKISRITGLADDIAMRLAATGVRIEAPIPGKAAVGIEIPNRIKSMVCLREMVDTADFRRAQSKLTVALGKDITGQLVMVDLAKMPHLLIAGTTGSGKSVCTNSMIQSVLFRARPDEVRLLLIDPKQVEFMVYNGVPHLIVPVVTDPRKAAGALGWAVTEMLSRYQKFASAKVRDIKAYNELAAKNDQLPAMPQILIVIDELADLMMAAGNEVEDSICRLAQMARAAGMHMVIATQRPSVDVITGLIKANIPSRLALTVASAVDSRTIIDTGGAEKLLGNGDMLFMPMGLSKPIRVQGCFVSDREVNAVIQYLKPAETDDYDESVMQEIERQAAQVSQPGARRGGDSRDESEGGGFEDSDPMLEQAVETVIEAGEASTSLLQRKLRLGYARAGRLIDEMESRGIVGPHEGSKPRKVLMTRQQFLERNMMTDDPLE